MTFEIFTAYRGISSDSRMDAPFIKKVRKNRVPRDIPIDVHLGADDWFFENFGIRYRSQALFITGNPVSASHYAASSRHIVRVIPLGEYKICWSPINSDLFLYGNHAKEETIEKYLELGRYQESDLEEAIKSGHEIMLYCDQYIAIPVHLLG